MSTKKVLLYGITGNLGKQIALELIYQGYGVIGVSRNREKALEALNGIDIDLHEVNIEDESEIVSFIQKITPQHKHLVGFIHAAGNVLTGPLESYSPAQINKQMQVNFFSVVHSIKHLIPVFKANKSGHFIAVSSICGLTTFPLFSLYHASKFALEGFIESLHYELKQFGIKATIVAPGGMKSDNGKSTGVTFGEINTTEYDALFNNVHKGNWYPSFITQQMVAQHIVNELKQPSNKLRIILGEESTIFLRERLSSFEQEEYLLLMQNRILKKTSGI